MGAAVSENIDGDIVEYGSGAALPDLRKLFKSSLDGTPAPPSTVLKAAS